MTYNITLSIGFGKNFHLRSWRSGPAGLSRSLVSLQDCCGKSAISLIKCFSAREKPPWMAVSGICGMDAA